MKAPVNLSARSLQYYLIAKNWISDLEFFKIEATFFHHLLDDYFVRLSAPVFIDKLKLMENRLIDLEEERHQADKQISEQITQLELMAEDIVPENSESLETKQIHLENSMKELTIAYRSMKKDLFVIVEEVIRDDTFFES
ncbi:hypothetical protein [Pedobacter sp. ASV28]|uniref:hypothetical protein n=1 Tax=Pedobacter sp. ASV28 TaxID=2795123 RepID=UPI0018EA93EF|nr:hypothetical protein [Pedobacter sp. ASV28]